MGLVAWMLIVTMMGAGIGRTSNTLELRGARRVGEGVAYEGNQWCLYMHRGTLHLLLHTLLSSANANPPLCHIQWLSGEAFPRGSRGCHVWHPGGAICPGTWHPGGAMYGTRGVPSVRGHGTQGCLEQILEG